MHKYLIRFSKKGYIRFTSHLDMIRLFQRGMKRAGVTITYSQGFHPHPRMSIVLPLSLGYTSAGEYVEIETDEAYEPEDLQQRLSAVLPEGIDILMVKTLPAGIKSPAALVEYGAYEIYFAAKHAGEMDADAGPNVDAGLPALQEKTKAFLSQAEIPAEKLQKKTGKKITIDMKPLIYQGCMEVKAEKEWTNLGGNVSVYNNNFTLILTLKTGSTSNLNPELLLKEYFAFTGIQPAEGHLLIHRTDLFFVREGEPVSLSKMAE